MTETPARNPETIGEMLLLTAGERRPVTEFAFLGLLALVLANGGAIIAMVIFITRNDIAEEAVGIATQWFLAGLGLVLVAILAAYFAHRHFARQRGYAAQKLFNGAYGRDEAEVEADEQCNAKLGGEFQTAAILGSLMSFLAFFLGCARLFGMGG